MALKNSMHVVIAMPSSCFQHSVVKGLFESVDNDRLSAIHCDQVIDIEQSTTFFSMLSREYRCIRFYREAITKANKVKKIDVVVIPTFDDAVIMSGMIGVNFSNTPWIGIVMRQKFHYSAAGLTGPPSSKLTSIKHYLFVRLLKGLTKYSRVLTIDETLDQYITSNHPNLKSRIGYIPDPVDDRRKSANIDLRSTLNISDDVFVILAYGSLRPKKGVALLLNALHKLPENVHALLAGNQSPEIKACVNSEKHKPLIEANRVHQIDRYIDVSEDPKFFTSSDMVWLAYDNYFQMSAVMVQAAQYRRPTVATKNGQIGFLTNKYQTGLLVDTTDFDDLHTAVIKLKNNEFCPTTRNYDAFSTAFSLSAFENTLLESIDAIGTSRANECTTD